MLLFCAKPIVKESCNFELAHWRRRRRRRKKNILATWRLLVWYFCDAFLITGWIVRHENTQRWNDVLL